MCRVEWTRVKHGLESVCFQLDYSLGSTHETVIHELIRRMPNLQNEHSAVVGVRCYQRESFRQLTFLFYFNILYCFFVKFYICLFSMWFCVSGWFATVQKDIPKVSPVEVTVSKIKFKFICIVFDVIYSLILYCSLVPPDWIEYPVCLF